MLHKPGPLFSLQSLIAHKLLAKPIFREHNFLFEMAAEDLISRLSNITYKFSTIAELAFLPTTLTTYLQGRADTYYQLNIHPELSDKVDFITDLETLPLEPNSIDLFIACLNLHWVNDLPKFLAQIKYSLKPGGMLLASCFGERSLHQLRYAIYMTQEELGLGFSQHISPFLKTQDGAALLQYVGFDMVVSDCNDIMVEYATLNNLFQDLRGMGETNNMLLQHNPFTYNFRQRLEINYRKSYQLIQANYDIVALTGSVV